MKAKEYTKETILNLGVYERSFPRFSVGDTVQVTVVYGEATSGKKKQKTVRNQVFEGVVIAKKGKGVASTFTVRKVVEGIAVERVFPYYSPQIISVAVKHEGAVRRAKLYYLRERFGKAALPKKKKKEKIIGSRKAEKKVMRNQAQEKVAVVAEGSDTNASSPAA
jgi:large subunit ribosomal protein L19